MDITIELEDYILNIRAAVVIIHNDKVLVHRNINSNHYALVGGRVELGEDTIKNIEGKNYLQYEWIERNWIDQIPLMPAKIQSVLKNGKYPLHVINKD